MEHRDPLDPEPLTQLVADERHGPAERRDGLESFRGLADDADPHLRMAQVPVRLDLGDRGEAHPRVGDIARDDAADLLAQEFVHPFRSLAHRPPAAPGTGRTLLSR